MAENLWPIDDSEPNWLPDGTAQYTGTAAHAILSLPGVSSDPVTIDAVRRILAGMERQMTADMY